MRGPGGFTGEARKTYDPSPSTLRAHCQLSAQPKREFWVDTDPGPLGPMAMQFSASSGNSGVGVGVLVGVGVADGWGVTVRHRPLPLHTAFNTAEQLPQPPFTGTPHD
jgi:hypothetical protein